MLQTAAKANPFQPFDAVQSDLPWQRYYEAAILETDASRLPKRIKVAHAAINARLEELQDGHSLLAAAGDGAMTEKQKLADALLALRVLWEEAG
jgi:hypothetical protein